MFPLTAPGDDKTPFQMGLKGSELEEKLMDVFDAAIGSCSKMWSGIKHDSGTFPTIMHKILCRSNGNGLFNDEQHEAVHKRLQNIRKKDRTENTESLELLQFLVSHCTRTAYKLEFARCHNSSCAHCMALPNRETAFVQF